MQNTSQMAARAPSGAYRSGVVIAGKYSLARCIGVGAMGTVWSAVNLSTGGQVALKLIERPEPELRQRLLREARTCAAIQHKNVVQMYDVAQTELGDPFLVMELLRGDTLAALLLHRRCLPQGEAVLIARDIARGLAAAHEHGTVHRDLKPANVFLHKQPGEQTPVIKLLDFGVSKSLTVSDGLETIAGSAVGSPMYMSPEQARGEADIDCRADLWSLGVVLYEMLTGERPFSGDCAEVLFKITHAAVPRVSSRLRRVEPVFDDIVAACLTRDRNERAASAAEIAAQLDAGVTPVPRGPQASPIEKASIEPRARPSELIVTSPVQGLPTPPPASPPIEAMPPALRTIAGLGAAAIASPGDEAAQEWSARALPGSGAQRDCLDCQETDDEETLLMASGQSVMARRANQTVQPIEAATTVRAAVSGPVEAIRPPADPAPAARARAGQGARRARSFLGMPSGMSWIAGLVVMTIAVATFLTLWWRSAHTDGPVPAPSTSTSIEVPLAPSTGPTPPVPPLPPRTEPEPAPLQSVVPSTPVTGSLVRPIATSPGTSKSAQAKPKKKCPSKFGLGCSQ